MAFAGISQTAAIGTPTLSHTSLTLWPSQVMAFLKGQRVQTEGHGDIPAQRLCHLPHHQDLHGHPFQDHLPQVRPHCKDENPLAWGYEQGWLFAGEINGAETCRLGYHPMWGTKPGMERAGGQGHWQQRCPSCSCFEVPGTDNFCIGTSPSHLS